MVVVMAVVVAKQIVSWYGGASNGDGSGVRGHGKAVVKGRRTW
jgi:hypothetical protein